MLDRLRAVSTAVFTPVARLLLRLGVSPDAVTVVGTMAVVVSALWFFPRGQLVAGPMVIAFFVFADSLDGVMARSSGRSGPWGAFLDSTLDRLADAAIFTGVAAYFALRDDLRSAAVAVACLVLGMLVSYARARAEGLGMTATVGIAERADRLAVTLAAAFAVGLGLPPAVLTVAMVLLAVASAVTVVQRMAVVHRQARGEATP